MALVKRECPLLVFSFTLNLHPLIYNRYYLVLMLSLLTLVTYWDVTSSSNLLLHSNTLCCWVPSSQPWESSLLIPSTSHSDLLFEMHKSSNLWSVLHGPANMKIFQERNDHMREKETDSFQLRVFFNKHDFWFKATEAQILSILATYWLYGNGQFR